MIYSEGLVRARESIAREIKEINDNMDDDTIVRAIVSKQEESFTSEQADNPVAEVATEKNEAIMKRLSVGLLSRRESGQVSGVSQDVTAGARTRRVTFTGYNGHQPVTGKSNVSKLAGTPVTVSR